MSTESAVRFIEQVGNDVALEQELRRAVADPEDHASIVSFAAGHGHSFTTAELGEVLDLCRRGRDELSQTDLESVAGGLGPQPEPPDMPLRGRIPRLTGPSWLLGKG